MASLALQTFLAAGAAQSNQDELETVQQAFQRHNYAEAEEVLHGLVAVHPESGQIWHNLGIALHLQGKSHQAIKAFRQALDINEDPGTLALLGLNYCRLRDYEKVRPLLQRAKKEFDDPKVLAVLGPCYLEAGEPLDAIQVYQRLVRLNVQPADANKVKLARAYFQGSLHFSGRLEALSGGEPFHQALKAAGAGSAKGPRAAVPLALERTPGLRADMPLEELAERYARQESDPTVVYLLALACGEKAMEMFRRAHNEFPDSPYLHRLKAEMHASQGNPETAIAEYEAILKNGAALPGLHHDLAVLYGNRADWEKALDHLKKELAIAPYEARAIKGVSDCLKQLGRDSENQEYLMRLAESGPTPEWALLELGAIEQRALRYDSAIGYLERAVRKNRDKRELHYRLGRLYLRVGRKEDGKRELEIFHELEHGKLSSDSQNVNQQPVPAPKGKPSR